MPHHNGTTDAIQTVFSSPVHVTNDYGIFDIAPENRDVSDRHVSRLVASIKQRNLLSDYPILVSEDHTIIDGQHRFVAAQELGLPIYYRFATKTTWGDLGHANANVKKWLTVDYLKYWAEKGRGGYIFLRDWAKRNPHVPLSVAVRAMSGRAAHQSSDSEKPLFRQFADGQWTPLTVERANKLAEMIKDFERFYDGTNRHRFVVVLARLIDDPRYDHERMTHQLRQYGRTVQIVHAMRYADYHEQLEFAYNYNRREKVEKLGYKKE